MEKLFLLIHLTLAGSPLAGTFAAARLSRELATRLRQWLLVGVIVLLTLSLTALEKAHGAAFHVNSTGDGDDAGAGDDVCATANGQCTLRAAIQEANSQPSNDDIRFAIPTTDQGFDPGTGRHTINLTKALPPLTTYTVIARGSGRTTGVGLVEVYNIP